jgi:hypothetical protein
MSDSGSIKSSLQYCFIYLITHTEQKFICNCRIKYSERKERELSDKFFP